MNWIMILLVVLGVWKLLSIIGDIITYFMNKYN